MKRSLRGLVLALALVVGAASVPSCAAVVSALPTVRAVLVDALLILDQIDSFTDGVFAVRPNAELHAKIEIAISKTKLALATANRLASGSEKASQAQLSAAFEDFRVAYQNLIGLVGPLGVTTGDALRAVPGGLQVPEPLALSL